MAQILVIEDNNTMRDGILQILSKAGYDARGASGGRHGVELFEQNNPDFVITDLKMEDMDGMEVLRAIREKVPDAMVMMITAFGTIETAVEAMRLGAFDFITKPFPADLLRMKVNQAIHLLKMRAENQFLITESQQRYTDGMIGDSLIMETLRDQIARVALTDSSVLITGESGTGKELVARAIHASSPRSKRPFIKVDCSALAEGVLESELFGHERGAFTGATQRKLGRFELADGGTLFLDEAGEISPLVQLKLLRILQDRNFERVGGTRTVQVDVRLISATNKNLEDEIRIGRFREDLFYRLHIVPIHVRPLRERNEDIPALVRHFLTRMSQRHTKVPKLSEDAMKALCAYHWPGNIRELENLLERLVVLQSGSEITLEDIPNEILRERIASPNVSDGAELALNDALETLEKELIFKAFEKAGGVKTKTAELLGIKTSALYYKMEKYGIHSKSG